MPGRRHSRRLTHIQHGLLVVGGRNEINYKNNVDKNPAYKGQYKTAQNLKDGNWIEDSCLEYPIAIIENQMIEINGDIWSFGGHIGDPLDDVFRLKRTSGNKNCNFGWVRERKMLSTRSGFSIVQNRFENSVLLIGATLKGKNKPMERIGFTYSNEIQIMPVRSIISNVNI